jgi:hypothetical protein|tara:strand:+ start:191 stop:400 length:210 start_codon:yes stop_codon:yes gene_type:complete
MGKLKEYYHEEINRGIAGEDKDHAVSGMVAITDATNNWLSGKITTAQWVKAIMREVVDFENRHDPCQPK